MAGTCQEYSFSFLPVVSCKKRCTVKNTQLESTLTQMELIFTETQVKCWLKPEIFGCLFEPLYEKSALTKLNPLKRFAI